MIDVRVKIESGDYSKGGQGSKEIKEGLRKIGVAPTVIRRAVVAVYEAEMNVVIHSHGGILHAVITEEALEVVIEDSGPGICDIEQALREGYSTAPAEARELGFGAGMGLPNIRRNTDRFTIESRTDTGTKLHFAVVLQPEIADQVGATALTVNGQACIKCLHCLSACPTGAIRLRDSGPEILRHLCLDCTSCMEVCPQGVFDLECTPQQPVPAESGILVISQALVGQLGAHTSPDTVLSALSDMGWKKIVYAESAEKALLQAAAAYMKRNESGDCRMAPVCPAVLNLIQLRYPSLIQYVLPFLSPFEIIRDSATEGCIVFMPSCPAQSAQVRGANALTCCKTIHPRALVKSLLTQVKNPSGCVAHAGHESGPSVMTITGMKRVCQFLDKAERGQVDDCGLVALYACDSGCFGAPMWDVPPALAALRAATAAEADTPLQALYRVKPLEQRAGARLDSDMARAIKKLAAIDRLSKQLPGRNCGVCGAPTCLTLAEDVVMERAALTACIFNQDAASVDPEASKENNL